jgi:hypothetical protein
LIAPGKFAKGVHEVRSVHDLEVRVQHPKIKREHLRMV